MSDNTAELGRVPEGHVESMTTRPRDIVSTIAETLAA